MEEALLFQVDLHAPFQTLIRHDYAQKLCAKMKENDKRLP